MHSRNSMHPDRYEQDEDFFVKMFSNLEMMKQIIEAKESVLYGRLKNSRA